MKASLIVPCFNEEKNISHLLDRCEELFFGKGIEVVIVENGSNDNSYNLINKILIKKKRLNFIKLVKVPENLGYGHGILKGIENSSSDIIGWTHADQQTDLADFLTGLHLIEKHKRRNFFVKGKRRGRPFFDNIFTFGMSIFETLLLRQRLWDINAQPTIFHKTFSDSWENPPNDFSLDLFAFYSAKVNNFKIIRFPVIFSKRLHGESSWNINFESKLRFIKRTMAYSLELYKKLNIKKRC